MAEDGLRIHLLGQPRLFFDGLSFPFAGKRNALPLLAYLLLHRTSRIARDFLAFTLWPDMEESEALAALRRALHELSKELPSSRVAWINSADDTLGWNPEAHVVVDAEEFEALSQRQDTLEAAVAMYHGDLRGQVVCMLNMHANAVWRGDKLAALELAERGLALANETDSPPLQSWALMCFGGAQRDLRNVENAIAALESARTIIETLEAPLDIYEVKTELALAHLMAGHTELARGLTEECLEYAKSQPFDVGIPEHLYWLAARVFRASGDVGRSTAFLDRAFELIERAARDMDSPTKRDVFMKLSVTREIVEAREQNIWPAYAGTEQPSANLA